MFDREVRALLLATLLPIAACASSALEPRATGRGRGASSDTVVATAADVEVRAQLGAWHGTQNVYSYVTPVWLSVRNDTEQALRIRYDDVVLTSDRGETYHALPPYNVEGTVARPVVVTDYPFDPDWDYAWYGASRGFLVPPYTARYYRPDTAVYRGPFSHDPHYYRTYYRVLTDVALPTPHMVRLALPEGVVEPGGYVSGFLYFEEVPRQPGRAIDLELALVAAGSRERIGSVELAFQTD